MKVIWINDYRQKIGGVEMYIHLVLPFLRSRGVQIKDIYIEDTITEPTKTWKKFYTRHMIQFKADLVDLIADFRPDLIHIHNNKIAARSVFAAASHFANIGVVQTIHDQRQMQLHSQGILQYFMSRFNTEWQRNTIDTFIAHSDFIHRLAMKKFPHIPCVTIPLFYNPTYTGKQNVPRHKNLLLYVGRIEPEKGVQFLVDTFLQSDLKNTFKLHLCGSGSQLEHLKNKTKNDKNIIFHGKVNSQVLHHMYKSATMLIIPSLWEEPFGLIGIEASHFHLPVIASNIGGIPEWCIHEKTGLLFEPGNSKDLLKQIRYLISHPDTAKLFAQGAYTASVETYTQKKHIAMLLSLYHSIIKEKL